MAQQLNHTQKPHSPAGIGLAGLLLLLGAIALLSAVVRIMAMAEPLSPTDPADAAYLKHPLLSLFHLLPGMIFLLLGPLQFISSLRARRPTLHRWCGRLLVLAGFGTAISAIVIDSIFPPVGGVFKSAAVVTFSITLMLALTLAVRAILHRDLSAHRAWMIRAFAIGLGVSTMRLYFIPVYFLYGIPSDFNIGLGMWLGFSVNLIAAEVIIGCLKLKNSH